MAEKKLSINQEIIKMDSAIDQIKRSNSKQFDNSDPNRIVLLRNKYEMNEGNDEYNLDNENDDKNEFRDGDEWYSDAASDNDEDILDQDPTILTPWGFSSFTNFARGDYKKYLSEARHSMMTGTPPIKYVPLQTGDSYMYKMFNIRHLGKNSRDDFGTFLKKIFEQFGFIIISQILFKVSMKGSELRFLSKLLMLSNYTCCCSSVSLCKNDLESLTNLTKKYLKEIKNCNVPERVCKPIRTSRPDDLHLKITNETGGSKCLENFCLNMKPTTCIPHTNQTEIKIPIFTPKNNVACSYIVIESNDESSFHFVPIHNVKEIRIYTKYMYGHFCK